MSHALTWTLWLAAASAHAAPRYGRAGCGLGALVMGPSGNQTSAVTSNQISYNQAFGISSGTSNCQADRASAAEIEQESFITANLATVSKEMAQGSGEVLEAFSAVLGCTKEAFPAVSAELKRSYRAIFSAPGALAVLDAAKEHLKQTPALAHQCSWLT